MKEKKILVREVFTLRMERDDSDDEVDVRVFAGDKEIPISDDPLFINYSAGEDWSDITDSIKDAVQEHIIEHLTFPGEIERFVGEVAGNIDEREQLRGCGEA